MGIVGLNGINKPVHSAQFSNRFSTHVEQTGDSSDEWDIIDDKGNTIAYVVNEDKSIAEIISKAINEYVDSNGLPSTRNNSQQPRRDVLYRSIEDAIRRSRQTCIDRALDGVSIVGDYGKCMVHAEGKCPSLTDVLNPEKKAMACEHSYLNLILTLVSGKKYMLTLTEVD